MLGGDGTILRAAEITLKRNIPLLGINMGHVGFMAEVERPSIAAIAESIISKSYVSEDRMTLRFSIEREGKEIGNGWALNEVTVERDGTTMVELFVEIGRRTRASTSGQTTGPPALNAYAVEPVREKQ